MMQARWLNIERLKWRPFDGGVTKEEPWEEQVK